MSVKLYVLDKNDKASYWTIYITRQCVYVIIPDHDDANTSRGLLYV